MLKQHFWLTMAAYPSTKTPVNAMSLTKQPWVIGRPYGNGEIFNLPYAKYIYPPATWGLQGLRKSHAQESCARVKPLQPHRASRWVLSRLRPPRAKLASHHGKLRGACVLDPGWAQSRRRAWPTAARDRQRRDRRDGPITSRTRITSINTKFLKCGRTRTKNQVFR